MNINEMSGSTLAYIGDAVWSLLVREYLVQRGYHRPKDLQQKSVKLVSAKAQAKFYFYFEENNFFLDEEKEIFKRGRNFKGDSVPKNTDVSTYRTSTGFEAIVGYWHITKNENRLKEAWEKVKTLVEV